MWYIELLPRHLRQQLILFSLGTQLNRWIQQSLTKDNLPAMKFLLAHDVPVNYCYNNERTLLFGAIFHGRNDIASHLISLAADINARDASGVSILDIAIRCENVTMVQKLLQLGADVATQDHIGTTILMSAAASSRKILELVLAEPNTRPIVDKGRLFTPLTTAICDGLFDNVQLLLDAGCSPTLRVDGRTPLEIARKWLKQRIDNKFYTKEEIDAMKRIIALLIAAGAD